MIKEMEYIHGNTSNDNKSLVISNSRVQYIHWEITEAMAVVESVVVLLLPDVVLVA